MQTLRKKTSPCKYKNEPSRFLGEGVSFKAKLIGILEVSEARGDRMCQEALADLKMAIRAAGEHKQRININIAIDGLRLRDEKNGDCLYHHPVHKISFIAQDMSDSRAFGYIFGSPDTGHRFFGIKTDKAASQVVIAMRDLFQVVFELKKKEIELAKQHIEQHQQKAPDELAVDTTSGSKTLMVDDEATMEHSRTSRGRSGSARRKPTDSNVQQGEQSFRKMKTIQEDSMKDNGHAGSDKPAQQTSEVIADLLDLEFELNSIQQGIHQMERITPSDPFGPSATKGDPFGDSFAPPAVTTPSPPKAGKPQAVVAIPPPPSAKDPSTRPSDPFAGGRPHSGRRGGPGRQASFEQQAATAAAATTDDKPSPGQQQQPPPPEVAEKHWFDRETEALFDDGELKSPPVASPTAAPTQTSIADKVSGQTVNTSPTNVQQPSTHIDVFMDLDPLGTGRNKPYIDRKDFFQELKNPPKKVLKDLVTESPNEATAPLFKANFDMKSSASNQTYLGFTSEGAQSSSNHTISSSNLPMSTATIKPSRSEVEVFELGSGFKNDPFEDESFVSFTSVTTSAGLSDPFNTDFADFTTFASDSPVKTATEEIETEKKSETLQQGSEAISSKASFHGPLRVSLPPEKENAAMLVAPFPELKNVACAAQSSSVSLSRIRSRSNKLQKQITTPDIIRLPSPKTQQMLADLNRQKSFDICSGPLNTLSRLTSSPTPPITVSPLTFEGLSPSRTEGELKITNSVPSKVASFPETPSTSISSSIQTSRIDHQEIAPEPPPRPTASIMPIKPPPLPPKRQQAYEIFKPPPRPPHVDEHSGYDYIDEFKTSSMLHEVEDMNKVPMSIRTRTLQFDDSERDISVPRRPRRESSTASTNYVPSFPSLPQPSKKLSPMSTDKISFAAVTTIESFLQTSTSSIACSTNEPQFKKSQHQKASLDITLSQLTKTGLAELAHNLGVSTDHLSKMTLQDFTDHLSKISSINQSADENGEEAKSEVQNIKREKYLTLRESVDEEPMFSAEFENHFDNTQLNEKLEDVFQNPAFDKYAVFRELIDQESQLESSKQPQSNEEKLLDVGENLEGDISEIPDENSEYKEDNQDRYAALREICINGDKMEKESTTAFRKNTEIQVEDEMHTVAQDVAGTFETSVVREPTSIIETTIEEEDIAAIRSEDVKSPDKFRTAKKQGDSAGKISSPETKYEHQIIQTDIVDIVSSDHEIKKISDENLATSGEETKSPEHGWAKFDMKPLSFERPQHETPNEEAISPWSSDGKELMKIPPSWQEEFSTKSDMSKKYKQRSSPWKEEESEEFWEDVNQQPHHENGWSDGEPFYDDMVHVKERRARRKKTSPWKDRKICRDVSPLERMKRVEELYWKGTWKRCKDRSMDEEEDEEGFEYNRGRLQHRESSWDDERRRRHGSIEYDGDEYEYGPKQRPSPWRMERDWRGSWESGSWDEEDRFSQREYPERWLRNDEEDEYRRRFEPDDGRSYGRSRKYSGGSDGDYGHREYVSRRRHRNYRDRSRESPWEEDFSEHEREDSLRYGSRKRNWPMRPNSASETRRIADKHSPGDYKPRQFPCGGKAEASEKTFTSEWRYRDRGARPRSRESYFNSDQEYDYWPPHKSDKALGQEQRSQTLQMRRNRRYRKPQDYGYNQKSPFDDDFSLQSFDIPDIELKDTCPITSDQSAKSSEEMFHNAPAAPSQDPSNLKADATPEADTPKTRDSPYTPIESQPPEDVTRPCPTRSAGQRQSPFEDDFTVPETHVTNVSKRYTSSMSSEVSDYLRSPFEDAHFAGRIESVAEEPACDSDSAVCDSDSDPKNGKEMDDVFLPMDNAREGSPIAARFRREDAAFVENAASKSRSCDKQFPGSMGSGEDSGRVDKPQHHMKTRLSLLRADSTSSLRKSESVNIFVRETDPFDDEFFITNEANPSASESNANKRRDRSKANSDTTKWAKAFDYFGFEEGQ